MTQVKLGDIQRLFRATAKSLLSGVCGGNVGGREAAVEPTRMYLRRFPEEIPDIRDDRAKRSPVYLATNPVTFTARLCHQCLIVHHAKKIGMNRL